MPNGPLSSRPPLLALVLIAIALAAGGIAACTFGDAPPTAPPTATPTVAPTATPIPVPTATPTSAPTATPTAAPTATPTAAPTATPTTAPTATPTTAPTATPTAAPTATPTVAPTAMPTVAPTATPTAEGDELTALKTLEEDRPTLASAITSLPWVDDGIAGIERQALRALVDLETLYGTDADPALANKTWLSDGVDERDVLILTWLGDFVSYGEAEAGRLVRMPFLDSLDEVATDTLQALDELGKPVNRRWLYSAVLAEPWVEDGLDQSEIAVIDVLQGLGLGALSSALLDKPWVEDGVKEFEVAIVRELGELAGTAEGAAITILGLPFLETPDPLDFDGVVALGRLAAAPEVLGALLEREWVGDGLDEPEAQVTDRLRRIAQWDDDIALRIVATPFLRTLEPVDVAAVETLWEPGWQ